VAKVIDLQQSRVKCQVGHNLRKVKDKTVTETFATPAELHKAQREMEARFRQLAQAYSRSCAIMLAAV